MRFGRWRGEVALTSKIAENRRMRRLFLTAGAAAALIACAYAQTPGRSNNPFETPIPASDGVIAVNFVEFATVPDAGSQPPRMNNLVGEAATRRMFVNTMQGMIYSVTYDGKTVKPYLDVNDTRWGNPVQF